MKVTKVIDALVKTTAEHPDPRYCLDSMNITPTRVETTNGCFATVVSHNQTLLEFNAPLLVSAKHLKTAIKVRGNRKDAEMGLTADEDTTTIHAGGGVFKENRQKGEFPDVNKMLEIPKTARKTTATLNIKFLKQILTVAEATGSQGLTLTFNEVTGPGGALPVTFSFDDGHGAIMPINS